MTRTAARRFAARTNETGCDAWLFDELDGESEALLAAYRDAAQAIRKADEASLQAAANATAAVPSDGEHDAVGLRRVQPSVLRLRTIDGIDPGRLAGLHGRLLASGYLTAEVVGRADGLAYRITRDGQRLLAGEAFEVDLEAA